MIILDIAKNNLLASRRRTLFLGGALFLVTLFFTVLLALTAGITDSLVKAATSVSSGHVNIGGFYKSSPTDSQNLVQNVARLRKEAREVLPDVVNIVDRLRGWGTVVSDFGSLENVINGIEFAEEHELFQTLQLAKAIEYQEAPAYPGLVLGNFADVQKPNGVILFAAQAKQLKAEVGDTLTVRITTSTGQVNTADLTVVAIARDLGLLSGFTMFAQKKTVVDLYRLKPDVTGVIQIYLRDMSRSKEAMNDLRAHFAKQSTPQFEYDPQPFFMKLLITVPGEDWTGAKLDVTTWEDESSFLTQIIVGLRAVTFALVMLLAIVIVVGISNTMTIAVRERTKEIGTLRAIGMRRGRVLALFMLEALILGIIATGLGGLVGAGLSLAVDAAHISVDAEAMRVVLLSDTLHLVPRVRDVLGAVLSLTLVCGLAALFPSLRASRVAPVTAMQAAE